MWDVSPPMWDVSPPIETFRPLLRRFKTFRPCRRDDLFQFKTFRPPPCETFRTHGRRFAPYVRRFAPYVGRFAPYWDVSPPIETFRPLGKTFLPLGKTFRPLSKFLGGLKETKMFLPHPRVKVSIVGSLRDWKVACSASDRQGLNFESCVWRTVISQSSHHPQEVLLAQFSLYVHKGGLKPDSFHFPL